MSQSAVDGPAGGACDADEDEERQLAREVEELKAAAAVYYEKALALFLRVNGKSHLGSKASVDVWCSSDVSSGELRCVVNVSNLCRREWDRLQSLCRMCSGQIVIIL